MKFKKPPKAPNSVWKNPLHFVAFGFGSGTLPYAPGTWGTLVAIPFYLILALLPSALYVFFTLVAIAGSVWICDKVSKEIKVHDHQGMCLDEIVGYLVTMLYVPIDISWIIVGFLLFRLFDIWKPYPIGDIDKKVKGGFGMIADDVVAGIYACIILHILIWIY